MFALGNLTHDEPVDFSFKESKSFRHPRRIHNVVPGDFTHTGKLDLLVMSDSQSSNQLDMILYPALSSGGFGTSLRNFYNHVLRRTFKMSRTH